MSEYGLTKNGVNIKRLDVIMDELHEALSTGWGVDTRSNNQSVLNVLLTAFADKTAELWEFGEQLYHNYHPASAEGVALDDACQFSGVVRGRARRSTYPIHCTGVDGTLLEKGTMLSSDTNPSVDFVLSDNTSLSRSACNELSVRLVSVGAGLYTISIDQTQFSWNATGAQSDLEILRCLSYAINTPSYKLLTSKPNDWDENYSSYFYVTDPIDPPNVLVFANVASPTEWGEETIYKYEPEFIATVDNATKRLIIRAANAAKNHAFLLSSNLTTQSVTSVIDFQSADFGDIVVPNGAITKITKGPSTLMACENKCGYIAGQLAETDAEFRHSYAAKIFNTSNRTLQAIRSGILTNVEGVTAVAVYENDSNETDAAGRPPHSIEVIVDGGANREDDIAQQIWLRKAGGIATYGTAHGTAIGTNDEEITVHFSRPTPIYIWWNVVVYGNPPSDYATQIAELITAYMSGLNTGDDVIPQRVFQSIFSAMPDVTYLDVTLGTTESRAETPAYTLRSVSLNDSERGYTDAGMVAVATGGDAND